MKDKDFSEEAEQNLRRGNGRQVTHVDGHCSIRLLAIIILHVIYLEISNAEQSERIPLVVLLYSGVIVHTNIFSNELALLLLSDQNFDRLVRCIVIENQLRP